MTALAYYMLLGLGAGGLYALNSSALIVAYRASGVVNFAQGAIATYAAYAFVGLREDGKLRMPWFDVLPTRTVNIPTTVTIASGPAPFALSVIIAVTAGTLLALGAYALVFRPLRDAAPLAKIIGAVGVLLYLQGVVLLQYGSQLRAPENVLPGTGWKNFLGLGRVFPQDRLWLPLIGIGIAVVVAGFYKFTRIGLVTRALADNETAGVLMGYSPVASAALSWGVAGAIAGFLGVVASPIAGLDPTAFTLMLVPALSVAMLARFTSPVLAACYALIFGIFESLVGYLSTLSWFPAGLHKGITQLIPLGVILVTLYLRSDVLPRRGALREKALPMVRPQINTGRYVVLLAALALIGAARFTGPWAVALTTSVISVVLMLSLVVLVGYIGQLSLAQLAIAGISAFALMRFMSSSKVMNNSPVVVSGPGLPFIVAAPLAVAAGTLVGTLVGLPTLRIRGVQLAIASIALALTIQEFVLEARDHRWRGRGPHQPRTPAGSVRIGPRAHDRVTGLTDRFTFAAFTIGVASILILLVARLRGSTTGTSASRSARQRASRRCRRRQCRSNQDRRNCARLGDSRRRRCHAGTTARSPRRQPIRILFRAHHLGIRLYRRHHIRIGRGNRRTVGCGRSSGLFHSGSRS